MSIVEFAREELDRAGLFDDSSDYGGALGDAVIDLIQVFSDQGHSGFSAGMVTQLFERLARYQPITPLTGDPDEWNEVGDGIWQNRRCPSVFKTHKDGAYKIDGRVFREPSGVCYTNSDSHVPITFPYTPVTEYVDVEAAPA